MIDKKKSPAWVTKLCFAMIIGAFAFSLITAFIPSTVNAQSGVDNEASYKNPEGIIKGTENGAIQKISLASFAKRIADGTGISAFINDKIEKPTTEIDPQTGLNKTTIVYGWQELLMVIVGFVIVWLGAGKNFEPLLLIPIGFGVIFVNIPLAGIGNPGHLLASGYREGQGFLDILYNAGVGNEFFPLFIFMGIGAMTDFGPLIANPKTAILGAASQFGVFFTLFGVTAMNYIPGVNFTIRDACGIAIIGGADGPTTIYIAAKLAPQLLATVAVAAYSYMALVPLIQPPIMRALTTKEERLIRMKQLRTVSKKEKFLFPMVVFILAI